MRKIQTPFAHLRIRAQDTSLAALAPRSVERTFLRVLGAGLIAFGTLGFVPPLMPNGHLLGVLAVNAPQNVLHLFTGATALVIARMPKSAHPWYGTAAISIFFGLLTTLGFASQRTIPGFFRVTPASNLLHLLIAVSALVVVVLAEYGRVSPSLAILKAFLGIRARPNKKPDTPPTSSRRNATA
ncbi:MAG: DUF4383 domain-containing protein [Ktedonobacterales bacterium]